MCKRLDEIKIEQRNRRERQRARELKAEKKRTLKQIAEILFIEGYSQAVRSLSWVHNTLMTLEARILHYHSLGYSVKRITTKLQEEGYKTRRSDTPTTGCVIYYLEKKGKL